MKASAVGWKGAWVVPVLALAWGVWPVKLAALPPQTPTVTGLEIVSDAGADSIYTLHEQIRVEVEFSDTVVVTGGPPRLTLGVGTATRHADYDSGTMTRKLIFAYRVQPSDTDTTTADGGISVPGPTIALNGGTIQAVGSPTAATLTLGSHTITNDREHQVQGTIEEAPKVGAMWISSSPGSDATYQAGDSITLDIRFDKPVDVTPNPQLRLNIGTETRQADYASGTGTTTLRFGYAVGPSDLDLDGISVETGMLTLNGGAILIQGGSENASLDLFSHPFPNNPGHKVDGRAGVVGVRIASSPTTNVYRLGERLTIHVVFSTSVRVTGAPRLGLTIGTQRRYARYTSGSGSATLAFSYTVQATDRDTNGFSVPSGWLILDGGTISPPGATLNANLNLQGHVIVNAAGHRVDGSQTLNPVFSASKYEFRLAENVAGPVLLGRVKATDPGGASVRYSLATGDKDRFAVDSLIGGVNYIGKGEDLEQQSSNILLIVRATGRYGQALVDVTVVLTDRNEAPTFPDTTYVFRLAENVRGPVEVGRVEATDPDGDALSYRLVTGGQGLFDVHASTGAVRYVGKGEDYEGTGASRWTLAVEAADTAGLRARTVATVALLDRNEAPTFPDTTYVFELKENVRGPVVVGVVRATDPDGDVLKYRLASGNVARFLVDGRTGRVFYQGTGEDYDVAGPKQWSLVVEAADTAGLRATTVASVVLLNENEVPTFPDTAYAFELNENVSGPVAVGTLRAADPDGDMLTYSMTAGDAGRFDVHATSGVVRYLGRGEDYEAAGPKRWRLTVVATDRSDLTAWTTVTVRLADVNEAPAFADTAYAFELIENARGPLTLGRVNATDPDRGDLPRYSLASGDAGRFQVNATNGVVRYVGTGEDYEGAGPKRWVLTLEATDRGGLKTRAKATVVLSNRNEAPVFADTAYAFDLAENARGQVTVGQVRAVDPDQGDVPRYGLTTGGGGRFEVDAVSGVVRYVGKGEDYEAAGPKWWTLLVEAADPTGLKGWTRVTVTLVDVNEAPEAVGSIAPKTLEAYGATVEEDLRPYFSDPEGDPLRYVAASSAPNVALVTVSASGRLSIVPQAVGVARATITATDPDGLKAEQQVQVTVETARAERSRVLTLALAAFGRSLGAETVDAIGGRLGAESSGTLGRSHLQLGGRSVGCGAFAGGRDACDLESLLHGGGALLGLQLSHPEAGRHDPTSRSRTDQRPTLNLVSRHNLLSRSSFQLSFGGGRANPDAASSAAAAVQSAPGTYSRWTLWGQAGAGGFEGRPDSTFTQEGRTNSAYAGVDYRFPSGLLVGLAGSYSVMESDFTSGINGEGSVDARLTSLYPYLSWTNRRGLDLWGLVGAGQGTADLAEQVGGEFSAGIDMRMAAVGVRQQLTGYFAVKADAFGVRIQSDSIPKMAGVVANAQRLRLAPQVGTRWPVGESMSLRTRLELGGRFDSGDAETGVGAEAGVQFGLSHNAGLTIDARGRMLLVHEVAEFREWGASFAVRLQPGRDAGGLSFSLQPSWGNAEGGARKLWQAQAGLVPQAARHHAVPATRSPGWTPDRMTAELGYGVLLSDGGRITPFGRWSREGDAGYRLATGARWTPLAQPANQRSRGLRLTVDLLAEEVAAPMRQVERRLGVQGRIGF